MSSPQTTIVELSGHIIDSLTLAKVIDTIQAYPCTYQINDIRIGQHKNDFSTAQISLWCAEATVLQDLLVALTVYGARPIENQEAHVAQAPSDATLPEGSYRRFIPPTEVFYQGQWLPVSATEAPLVITLDPATRTASLKPQNQIRRGDGVVLGAQGLRTLPVMEETAHASAQV